LFLTPKKKYQSAQHGQLFVNQVWRHRNSDSNVIHDVGYVFYSRIVWITKRLAKRVLTVAGVCGILAG